MGILFFILIFQACATTSDSVKPTEEFRQSSAVSPPQSSKREDIDPNHFILFIDEVEALEKLERDGFNIKSLLNETKSGMTSNDKLSLESPRYKSFADEFSRRIDANQMQTNQTLVTELQQTLNYPAGNVGRAFDKRWLAAKMASFELVGVVNRFDRVDMFQSEHCGEIRFIFRLSYRETSQQTQRYSRLPMTLNIVMSHPKTTDCIDTARQFGAEEGLSSVDVLLKIMPAYSLSRVEVNAQVSRYPSGLETEFAGQAVYLLQVYRPEGETLTPMELENTPAVHKIRKDDALKRDLIKEINNNIAAIDAGTHRLSKRFLATEALSFSTNGLNRLANKPYDVIFQENDDAFNLDLDIELQEIKSKASLIERLNNSTCMGCHQSQSTAGFHWLGRDRPASGLTNRIAIPFSGHFWADQERRRNRLAQEANSLPIETYRPHAAKPAYLTPKGVQTGGSCTPDSSLWAENFGWGCADERDICRVLAFEPLARIQFGTCVRQKVEDISAGMACRKGILSSRFQTQDSNPFNRHGYGDTFKQSQLYDLPEKKRFSTTAYNCRPPRIGVPLGRTFRKCTPAEKELKGIDIKAIPASFCAIIGGSKFDQCVEKDFHNCLSGNIARGMLDSCHQDRFCREDYICQSLPDSLIGPEAKSLTDNKIGFCTPTYFLFQMRLDGHPTPN